MTSASELLRELPRLKLATVSDRQRFRKLRELVGRIGNYAPLQRLTQSPLTVAGAGCFSTAAFIGNVIAGFTVLGACLVILELMITDGEA